MSKDNNNNPNKTDLNTFIESFYTQITKNIPNLSIDELKKVWDNTEDNVNKYFDPIITESRDKEKCLYDALGISYSKNSEISWKLLFDYLGKDDEGTLEEILHIISSPAFIQRIVGAEKNLSKELIQNTIIVNHGSIKQTAKEFIGRYADKIDFYDNNSEQITATAGNIASELTQGIIKDIQHLQEKSSIVLSDTIGNIIDIDQKSIESEIKKILKNNTVKNEPVLAKVRYNENQERIYIFSKGSKLVCQINDVTNPSIIQDTVDKVEEIEKLLKSSVSKHRKLTKEYFLGLKPRAKNNAIQDINNNAYNFIAVLVEKIFDMLESALEEQIIKDPTIKKWFKELHRPLIEILIPHFQDFVKEQIGNSKSYFYKRENNCTITKYYIQSLFGASGTKKRNTLVQGTLGEILFSAMLDKKLEEQDPQKNFEVKLLGQNFYNFTYNNKKFSGQHPVDIAIIIGGEIIGIQAKQYNSKDIQRDTENFYGKDYNAFDDSFIRYLLPNGKDNSTEFIKNSDIDNLIKYLRYQSILLRKDNSTGISATNLLWNHYLQFGRIKEQISKIAIDELENAKKQINDKGNGIMNNFFTYNFALVPTSYILENIKTTLVKVSNIATKEAQNKDVFTIKPMEVPSNKQEKFYAKYSNNITNMSISDDCKIVLNNNVKVDYVSAPINFVGVTVNLSKLYKPKQRGGI